MKVMKTLNMNYAKRSLYYSRENGWCMNRYYRYRSTFGIQTQG